jgi:hypothetical protein
MRQFARRDDALDDRVARRPALDHFFSGEQKRAHALQHQGLALRRWRRNRAHRIVEVPRLLLQIHLAPGRGDMLLVRPAIHLQHSGRSHDAGIFVVDQLLRTNHVIHVAHDDVARQPHNIFVFGLMVSFHPHHLARRRLVYQCRFRNALLQRVLQSVRRGSLRRLGRSR